MSISKELKEIKDFLESEKIGKIFIDKRPNGIILIETTETKKYQNRVCKKSNLISKVSNNNWIKYKYRRTQNDDRIYKFKELKSLDFIHTVFFCLKIKERGQKWRLRK